MIEVYKQKSDAGAKVWLACVLCFVLILFAFRKVDAMGVVAVVFLVLSAVSFHYALWHYALAKGYSGVLGLLGLLGLIGLVILLLLPDNGNAQPDFSDDSVRLADGSAT
jgi:hypothetical protein